VAVPTKQAWLYVFDRVTGEPIWPIEEKPVPKGDVPGEWYAPTQPHPPDRLRYARNAFDLPGDLIDFTPGLRAEAIERAKKFRWEATPFNPPMLGQVNGMFGSITVGTATNWPGGGYDPELHIAFAPAGNMAGTRSLAARRRDSPTSSTCRALADNRSEKCSGLAIAVRPTRRAPRAAPVPEPPATTAALNDANAGLTVQGLPMIKPPYGLLAAINLDRDEVIWQTPHGAVCR
jgi:quinoprotein glucose dehydrogenase